jgi:hypothetical protein
VGVWMCLCFECCWWCGWVNGFYPFFSFSIHLSFIRFVFSSSSLSSYPSSIVLISSSSTFVFLFVHPRHFHHICSLSFHAIATFLMIGVLSIVLITFLVFHVLTIDTYDCGCWYIE